MLKTDVPHTKTDGAEKMAEVIPMRPKADWSASPEYRRAANATRDALLSAASTLFTHAINLLTSGSRKSWSDDIPVGTVLHFSLGDLSESPDPRVRRLVDTILALQAAADDLAVP